MTSTLGMSLWASGGLLALAIEWPHYKDNDRIQNILEQSWGLPLMVMIACILGPPVLIFDVLARAFFATILLWYRFRRPRIKARFLNGPVDIQCPGCHREFTVGKGCLLDLVKYCGPCLESRGIEAPILHSMDEVEPTAKRILAALAEQNQEVAV